jgi:uncharacterized protein YegL
MKENYTKIIFVIDRSGSMNNIAKDMDGGLENFIQNQKDQNLGQCDVSLYEFDDEYNVVYENIDISGVKKYNISPRGATAMFDAVARTINAVGANLSQMKEDERPDRVLFVIITDGYENASKEFSSSQVQGLIEHQTEKYNWTFTYLGANQDAFMAGGNIGIDHSKILNYTADSSGTNKAWTSLCACTSNYRRSRVGGKEAAQLFNYHDNGHKEQI